MVFKKIIFPNRYVALQTPSRSPLPSFMANTILNFHFDYPHTSLRPIQEHFFTFFSGSNLDFCLLKNSTFADKHKICWKNGGKRVTYIETFINKTVQLLHKVRSALHLCVYNIIVSPPPRSWGSPYEIPGWRKAAENKFLILFCFQTIFKT